MIHEFTPVPGREPTGAELEAVAAARLDPIGTEGPHPAPAHRDSGRGWTPARSRSSWPATVSVTSDSVTLPRTRHV